MIKYPVYIIIILSFFSCVSKSNKLDRSRIQTTETIPVQVIDSAANLDGVYGLSIYFDSIFKHKSIAKFRMEHVNWCAHLIEIKNDSVWTYGSILHSKHKIDTISDTLCEIKGIRSKVFLVKENNELKLLKDSTFYPFRRRDDLCFLLDTLAGNFHPTNYSIRKLFNDSLIVGSYLLDGKMIEFKPDRVIKFWNKYERYDIKNYYGTSHRFGNDDIIWLTKYGKKDTYKWELTEDKLILTRYILESPTVVQNYLSDDKIILHKIN